MDDSLINYVKKISLQEQYNDPKSVFKTIAIPIDTLYNNGVIYTNTNAFGKKTVSNCCFFISLYQGIQQIFANVGTTLNYDTNTLFIAANYPLDDWGKMLDTNISKHKSCIQDLVELLGIRILIYTGKRDNVNIDKSPAGCKWTVSPEPNLELTPNNGICAYTIRIANNGTHFEYITSDDKIFIYNPITKRNF